MIRTAALLATIAIGCGAAPPPPAPVEAPAIDASTIAAERLLARRSIATLAAMPIEEREEEIFGALYNELDRPKPRAIEPLEYERRLAGSERAHDEGPWHVRWGPDGTAELANATRFYFDVTPDAAAVLATELTADLDRRGLRRYSFKVVRTLDLIDVPVAAVLYVEAADVDAAREASLAFAIAHPSALWPEEPPFTLRLADGLAMADEIGDVGPPGVRGNSFGGAMAHLMALAIEGQTDLSITALATRVRSQLDLAGFDPERPWRRPTPRPEPD